MYLKIILSYIKNKLKKKTKNLNKILCLVKFFIKYLNLKKISRALKNYL